MDTDHIAALDRQTVVACISDILSADSTRGYVDYYRFGIFQNQDGGSTVVVLDCFVQLQSAYNMLRLTVLVGLACAGIVLLLLTFFSRRAIRPFAENLEAAAAVCHRRLPRAENAAGHPVGRPGDAGGVPRGRALAQERPGPGRPPGPASSGTWWSWPARRRPSGTSG